MLIALLVVALLLLLLLLPVRLRIWLQDGETVMRLHYLFFSWAPKPGSVKPQEKPKAPKKPAAAGKPTKKGQLKTVLTLVREIIAALKRPGKRFFRGVRLEWFYLRAATVGANAAEATLRAGRWCALFYPVVGSFMALVPPKHFYSDISPSFWKQEDEVTLFISLRVPLFHFFALVLGGVFGVLPAIWRFVRPGTDHKAPLKRPPVTGTSAP